MQTRRRMARRLLLPKSFSARSAFTRRQAVAGVASLAAASAARPLRAQSPVYFGLTPVFLDSDIKLLAALESYLADRLRRPVSLVKRRTYQEITAMLLSEQLDAAWICGFPLVQHADQLALVAVPVWQGQPLYRSYIIASADDPVASLADMRGYVHAFSDPDSNSGFLVTRYLLTTMNERPETFFSRFFFTYGHRNVIRAVAAGLAQSGSVDGYVWEVVREIEPAMTERTRIVRKSELLGFPPVACNARLAGTDIVIAIRNALVTMNTTAEGRELLATLRLDGFTPGDMSLFEGIAQKYRVVLAQA
ncbi:MAG TPA: PhnD/SsuA/transferrin family substrate-binding protein [Candidatus Acidoferrum sp.]|nr:PhnD/SsuA/transferrin family substrate-binding protein [Candidatus Acidoferrum sp.]